MSKNKKCNIIVILPQNNYESKKISVKGPESPLTFGKENDSIHLD